MIKSLHYFKAPSSQWWYKHATPAPEDKTSKAAGLEEILVLDFRLGIGLLLLVEVQMGDLGLLLGVGLLVWEEVVEDHHEGSLDLDFHQKEVLQVRLG